MWWCWYSCEVCEKDWGDTGLWWPCSPWRTSHCSREMCPKVSCSPWRSQAGASFPARFVTQKGTHAGAACSWKTAPCGRDSLCRNSWRTAAHRTDQHWSSLWRTVFCMWDPVLEEKSMSNRQNASWIDHKPHFPSPHHPWEVEITLRWSWVWEDGRVGRIMILDLFLILTILIFSIVKKLNYFSWVESVLPVNVIAEWNLPVLIWTHNLCFLHLSCWGGCDRVVWWALGSQPRSTHHFLIKHFLGKLHFVLLL